MHTPISSSDPTASTEAATELARFFAAARLASREADTAVAVAKPALQRIAAAIIGHDHGQALRVRDFLLSLYTGGEVFVDLSDLLTLDWALRRDLCAVLLAFNHGNFSYDELRAVFVRAGDRDAKWLLGEVTSPRVRLREALDFAKPGPLEHTPRSSSERAMALSLSNLFADAPLDLAAVVRHGDSAHHRLLVCLVADHLAGRFDAEDRQAVARYFA